jgi:hypothetical protein
VRGGQLFDRKACHGGFGIQPQSAPDKLAYGARGHRDADGHGSDSDLDTNGGKQALDDFSLRQWFVVGHEIGLAGAARRSGQFLQCIHMGLGGVFDEDCIDELVRAG